MTELSVSTKQLLAAARDGLAPDRVTVARMQARIGAGAAASASTKAATAGKLALAAAVAGALTTALVLATRAPAPTATPPPLPPPPPSEVQVVPSIPVPPPTEIMLPPRPRSAPAPAAVKPVNPTATLAREVELLDSAEHAATTDDVAAARVYLRAYARETAGHGQLLEDATALSVDLACRDHDAAAADALASFDARWPHSAHRARLLAACAAD